MQAECGYAVPHVPALCHLARPLLACAAEGSPPNPFASPSRSLWPMPFAWPPSTRVLQSLSPFRECKQPARLCNAEQPAWGQPGHFCVPCQEPHALQSRAATPPQRPHTTPPQPTEFPYCSDALAFDAATCQTSCQASQFALATALALSQAIQQCGCEKAALAVAQVTRAGHC